MYQNFNKIYRAAIYVRLSKEDGDKVESDSIANQRDLIRHFLADKPDIQLVDEQIDDGYSGATFDRPSFQKMMEDVKSGKINCIIVKDYPVLEEILLKQGVISIRFSQSTAFALLLSMITLTALKAAASRIMFYCPF